MVGSIDPRCGQIRGTHWPNKVAWLIGTRVAEAILASGLQPHQRPDIWMQAIRSNLTKLLCHGGRPHMGPGVRRDDAEFFRCLTNAKTPERFPAPASAMNSRRLTRRCS